MPIQQHAVDLILRLSAIRPENTDDIGRLVVRAFEDAVKEERERCAKIAHDVSVDMQVQIDRNDEYKARTGSTDEEPNELCRRTQRCAIRIEESIRND